MSAQDLILGARVAHVRELKAEIERLKAENAVLKAENEALAAHFDLALLAAEDLAHLPEGGRLEIWDGWNLVLGAGRTAHSREELCEQARARLAADPALRLWIVFDGKDESVAGDGRLRVSYTGGTGAHRADRFILDFVRMAAYRGNAARVTVRTDDKDFKAKLARLHRLPRSGWL